MTQQDRDLVSNIETFGWQVSMIPDEDEGPGFAYSVGLFRSFGLPEIMVFGLALRVMHVMIRHPSGRVPKSLDPLDRSGGGSPGPRSLLSVIPHVNDTGDLYLSDAKPEASEPPGSNRRSEWRNRFLFGPDDLTRSVPAGLVFSGSESGSPSSRSRVLRDHSGKVEYPGGIPAARGEPDSGARSRSSSLLF